MSRYDGESRFTLFKCMCSWILLIPLLPLWIWLNISAVGQTSIKCSIEDFYMINSLQTTSGCNYNQSIIYVNLNLENNAEDMEVYFDNLNLTFSYYGSVGIVRVGNSTTPAFLQPIGTKTKLKDVALARNGISLQEIAAVSASSASSYVFRLDFASSVRFKGNWKILGTKSKTYEILAWAKVEVDPISSKKSSKKAIELEHMIKHDFSAWDFSTYYQPDYVDVVLPNNAPDPVNFDVGLVLSDQVDELGLGQANAPQIVVLDVEENEPQMGVGEVQEEIYHGNNLINDANLFAADPPLGDID
ncbi:hypothetical protein POM88_029749 [Heracleum sosnowskyi]|uniref:Uncharacterized protein n=1 Tax=Heracleum sosnowskyi TaxID=360622 RepID=A0AAD8HVM3_9APIA|nr:hypothetical protein POM88_029749 [Heracleum sosnowskyi]